MTGQLWKRRVGRPVKFETPDALWEACCEYFQWCDDNPLFETKAFAYQGVVTQDILPKMRAMTLSGMQFFIGLSRQGWQEYKAKPAFSDICNEIETVVYNQKFAGAAADLLNPVIIARDLGLKEKTESDVTATVSQSTTLSIDKTTLDDIIAKL